MPKAASDERRLTLGKNVKKFRERKHLSQEKLSERADIHVSYIGQIERGMRYPSLKTLFRIADALDIRITELFKGINAGNNKKNK